MTDRINLDEYKQFFPPGRFWKTIKLNNGERKVCCPMCNLTFTRPYNMKSHYLGHFDVKPFGCSVCSRRFLRINDLKRHQRIHGAEKEHSCTMCPQTFSREEALRRHELACLYEQTSKQEFLDMKQEATPPQSPVNPCSLDFILN